MYPGVILSIKPKHFKSILDGVKKVEFRRVAPKKVPKEYLVVLYVSRPVQRFRAILKVENLKDSIEGLWFRFRDVAGISEKEFLKYFNERKTGTAMIIKEFREIDLDPEEVFITFYPPMNYVYLDEEYLEKIEEKRTDL